MMQTLQPMLHILFFLSFFFFNLCIDAPTKIKRKRQKKQRNKQQTGENWIGEIDENEERKKRKNEREKKNNWRRQTTKF